MNGGQIGNVDLVKQLNSAAVYRLIDQQGPISRIQVAMLVSWPQPVLPKLPANSLNAASSKRSLNKHLPVAGERFHWPPKSNRSILLRFELGVITSNLAFMI